MIIAKFLIFLSLFNLYANDTIDYDKQLETFSEALAFSTDYAKTSVLGLAQVDRHFGLKYSANAEYALYEIYNIDFKHHILFLKAKTKGLVDLGINAKGGSDLSEAQKWLKLELTEYNAELESILYKLDALQTYSFNKTLFLEYQYKNRGFKPSSRLGAAKKAKPSIPALLQVKEHENKVKENEKLAFIEAVVKYLPRFLFDINKKKSTLENLNYRNFIPLYSAGILAALEEIETHEKAIPNLYANLYVEQYILHLIKKYGEATYKMDQYSFELLRKLQSSSHLNPFLRIAAFAIMVEHTDLKFALEKSKMTVEQWAAIYNSVNQYVMLSPIHDEIQKLSYYIDYSSDHKVNVNSQVAQIDLLRQRLGLKPVLYHSRPYANHPDLMAAAQVVPSNTSNAAMARMFRSESSSQHPALKVAETHLPRAIVIPFNRGNAECKALF